MVSGVVDLFLVVPWNVRVFGGLAGWLNGVFEKLSILMESQTDLQNE